MVLEKGTPILELFLNAKVDSKLPDAREGSDVQLKKNIYLMLKWPRVPLFHL